MLGPSRLDRATKHFASLLRAHIPPPSGAEAHSRPFYRRRREFSTRDIKQFDREIEQNFRWQTGLSHDSSEPGAPSDAKDAGEIG